MATTGIDTDQLQNGMKAIQEQQNANELAMYTTAANNSFQQSLAQTLGGLALDSAKAKPQV